jgi:hypothetical protein
MSHVHIQYHYIYFIKLYTYLCLILTVQLFCVSVGVSDLSIV